MVKKRNLTNDDVLVWEEVAKSVKPLRKRKAKVLKKTDNNENIPINIEKIQENTLKTKPIKSKKAIEPIDRKKAKTINKNGLNIDAKLDLHGMTEDKSFITLSNFIKTSSRKGLRNLLIITGKGRGEEGLLKRMVPRWLSEPKFAAMILHITEARPQDGGSGAIYVVLRKNRA